MAIRAALYVTRWLPFALVTIIKMHYNPPNPRCFQRLRRLLFARLQPVLFLWKASLSSFPPSSFSLSASRPFLRLFTLYVAENSTLAAGSSSLLRHLPASLPLLLYTSDVSRTKERERAFFSLFLFSI